jgi:hypothetical protein
MNIIYNSVQATPTAQPKCKLDSKRSPVSVVSSKSMLFSFVEDDDNHADKLSGYETESTCASTHASSSTWSYHARTTSLHQETEDCVASMRKRRVRFTESDADGSPVTFIAPPPEPRNEDEKGASFWKHAEFKLFRQYSKKLVITVYKSNGTKNLQAVYDMCLQKEAWDPTLLRSSHCSYVSHSPIRGLEVVAHQTILRDRRAAIRGILETQSKLAASPNRALVLGTTSQTLSRSHRRLARILGHSDHVCAQRVHAEGQPVEVNENYGR